MQWSNGAFTSESIDKTALLNANAIGQCEVLDQLLNLESEQLFQEDTDA